MGSRSIDRVPVRSVVRQGRGPAVVNGVAVVAAVVVIVAAAAFARGIEPARVYAVGGGAAASTRLGSAASLIANAIGPNGSGIGFFAVQRTTEYARTAGPLIPITDPTDDRTVIGQTDHLFINAMMSQGLVRSDGFFMDMRLGSETASASSDFAGAPETFSVLSKGGVTWRDDGAGWYATANLPGMGIDLGSALALPKALGHIGALSVAGTDTVNGIATTVFTGTLTPSDYPGAIAADGSSFTDSTISVKVWLDSSNRPVQLWLRARNTNQPTYDLISETTITLDFNPTATLPQPDPTMAPEPPPSADPATATTAP